jgi:hypothetical protein
LDSVLCWRNSVLTLGEEHIQGGCFRTVLRRIFGLKTGRKGQEAGANCVMKGFETCTLHQILFRVIKSRRMGWAELGARMGEMRTKYKLLVGGAERKIPIRKPKHRWDYNTRMDLRKRG